MIVSRFTLAVFLCACLLGPEAVEGQDDPSGSARQLEYFFRNPQDSFLPFVLNAVHRARDQEAIRRQLREQFDAQWVAGTRSAGPTLQQFDVLAKASVPFGPANSALVDMLAGPAAPSAWGRADFREYIRARLPATVDARATVDRLLERMPSAPAEVVARLAFLEDVLPEENSAQVSDFFQRQRILAATPSMMAAYHNTLLRLPGGFVHFRATEESRYIKRALGDRLYTLSPATWRDAEGALSPLVASSSIPPASFFGKAADHFRRQAADRGPAADVLAVLADLIEDPTAAFRLLDPGHDADWFAWLHTAAVLVKMHARRDLLESSYGILKGFAARDFGAMYPRTVVYYYDKDGYADRVFAELIRPQVNGPHAMAILRSALEPRFHPEHREILASDVLVGGDPLSASWTGASPLGRLEFAIAIYSHLLEPSRLARPTINVHLARPLLDEVVNAFLDLLRRPQPPTDRIVRLMETLAAHLEECRANGGDTAAATPLRRLESEVSADMTQAVAAIAEAGGEAQMRAVDRFIDRLTVALRIRLLVARALGRPPSWMTAVRESLRQRVFGIADPASNRTLYWGEELTRWRASVLERIDRPLRELMRETTADDEAQLWFRDVYVPLVRVHGFLKVLRDRNPTGYAHLEWVRADPSRKTARLDEVFAALQTDRWVDAEGAVTDFAREHWGSMRQPNLWTQSPDTFFAGRWGVNANLHVFRQFLNAAAPQPGANWDTPAIAAKVLGELETRRLPIGPAFPSSPGAADSQESVWLYAEWVENLVTAAEWQRSPFIGSAGPLRWQERLHPSQKSTAPFQFALIRNEVSRRVDGQLRLRLARLLLTRADDRNPTRARQLVTIAKTALLLPNHPDNGGGGGIEAARQLRQEVYGALYSAFAAASDPRDRVELVQQMMRLHVAARSGGKPEPNIDAVLQQLAGGGDEAAEAATDIQAERLALINMLDGAAEDNLVLARAYVDGQIRALLPRGWSEENANIIAAQFSEILKRLSESRVRAFLQLNRRMLTVADALVGEINRRADFTADLERLERSLELVNSHVWFTRRTFNPDLYFRPIGEGGDTWWPALVVLAWHDRALQSRTMDALARYKGPPDEHLDKVRNALQRQLLQLNEAIFATVTKLAVRNDASQILASRHAIPWRMLNLRLLAESVGTVEASPAALASGSFSGLLANYAIAGMSRQASDDALWQRLFGSLDYLLPPEERRAKSLGVNLDAAVRLADEWSRSDKIPAPLREAAQAFASASDERAKDLLLGAETPAGVMRAFHEILRRTGELRGQKGYMNFYVNAFTVDGRTLSSNLTDALAGPFFRRALPGQLESVEGMLDGWRQQARSGTANSAMDTAYRRSFDSVLAQLIRGNSRPQGAPYIWQPVDQLRNEDGVRATKPSEFLNVAKWLLALEKRYPEPELRALFARGAKQ